MSFPTTGILDSFNRADENPMSGWTDLYNGFGVVSNQAAGDSGSENVAMWNAGTVGPDCEAYLTIATKPATGQGVGVYARLKDTGSIATLDGYVVALMVASGTDEVRLYRIDNGVATQLGSSISQEFNNGDKLGIRVIGATITAWRHDGSSWTSLGSRTDTTYPAAGYLGIGLTGTSGRLDDFGGGVYAPTASDPITLSEVASVSVSGGETSWTIAVDWDRDASYDETYDDVSDRVISANWFLGMRKAYEDVAHDSMLELVLDNSDRRYSSEYTGSPLWDGSAGTSKVQPFRTVRVQSDDGTTTRTHWIGWIEKVEPEVNQHGERTVKVMAAGVLVFFEAAETAIALQENQRTDAILDQLIGEVVIPPALAEGWFLDLAGYSEIGISTRLADTSAFSELDEGRVTLAIAADNWVRRGNDGRDTFNVYQAIADVVAAERGRFFFDREGKAIFWNRLKLQDDLPSALTLDNDMMELSYSYAGIEDFKNEVVVNCHPRTVGATVEVLWRLTEPILLKKGERRQINVKFQDEDTGNARIGAKEVTVADVAFSKGTGVVMIAAKANSAVLEVVNSDTKKAAVLSGATVMGRKITDYGQMEAEAQDGLSIARYGRRRMKLNLGSVDNLEDALAIADYEVSLRSEPRGVVRQVTLKSHGIRNQGHHANQLARTVGDVITIRENQTQHGVSAPRKYVIMGEAHRLSAGQTLWETTWYLERAAEAPFPWKLGVEGRGELDEAAYLAF